MIRRLVGWLVLVPLCAVLIVFALANRQWVDLNFDPFSQTLPFIPPLNLPQFVVIYGALLVGVILGGSATWFTQGRHRREKRALVRETSTLKKELESARVTQKNKSASLGLPATDDLLEID
jgi:uncharacterized integral membrane protein